jgi:hypothetical protein
VSRAGMRFLDEASEDAGRDQTSGKKDEAVSSVSGFPKLKLHEKNFARATKCDVRLKLGRAL